MAELDRTQLGVMDVVSVDADPTSTSVDALTGSLITFNGEYYCKIDDGDTTNSVKISVMNVAGAYTKQQNIVQATLSDGANIAWDLDTDQSSIVTLAGNRTLDNPTNQKAGGTYALIVKQDATGGRTLAYGTVYKFPGGTAPTLSTAANAIDLLTFISDGTDMYGVATLAFS